MNVVLLACALVMTVVPAWAEGLPHYQPLKGLSGAVSMVGSRSGTEVIAKWGEAFSKLYPDVRVEVVGSGSRTAFSALIEARSAMAPMSRPMTEGMIDEFTKRRGYPPLEVRIGIGGVAVMVHPSNPIQGLTRAELDGIFSRTYFLSQKAILSWGDAGLTGEWNRRLIKLYGMPEESGPWRLLRGEASTLAGEMKQTMEYFDRPEQVADAVARDPAGIGFAPPGFQSADVKIVPIASSITEGAYSGYPKTSEARRRANEYVLPTPETLGSEVYALTRHFRIYIDRHPKDAVPPAAREFLKFGLSQEGQSMMKAAGYLPLPPAMARAELAKLD